MQGIICALKTDFSELQIKEYYGKFDLLEKAYDFSNVEKAWKAIDKVVSETRILKLKHFGFQKLKSKTFQ